MKQQCTNLPTYQHLHNFPFQTKCIYLVRIFRLDVYWCPFTYNSPTQCSLVEQWNTHTSKTNNTVTCTTLFCFLRMLVCMHFWRYAKATWHGSKLGRPFYLQLLHGAALWPAAGDRWYWELNKTCNLSSICNSPMLE